MAQRQGIEPAGAASSDSGLADGLKHLRLIAFSLLSVAALLIYLGATAEPARTATVELGKDPTVWELQRLGLTWRQQSGKDYIEGVELTDDTHPEPLIGEIRQRIDEATAAGEPSFDTRFPALAAQLDQYSHRPLDNAVNYAKQRAASPGADPSPVVVLGLPVKSSALPLVGPALLLLIQAYLYVHLRHLRRWTDSHRRSFNGVAPWIGVMDDRLARTLTWIGLTLLPAAAAFMSGGLFLTLLGVAAMALVAGGLEATSMAWMMIGGAFVVSGLSGLAVAFVGYRCGVECERLTDAMHDRDVRCGPIGRGWARLRSRTQAAASAKGAPGTEPTVSTENAADREAATAPRGNSS